jgi:hypothetical protein
VLQGLEQELVDVVDVVQISESYSVGGCFHVESELGQSQRVKWLI